MIQTPDTTFQPARVLIVDDESHNRQLLKIMLGPEGFVLQTAASGEEALAMVAKQTPDLILLDIMMPGMDGYEVASRIKDNISTKNVPIVMITALNDRNSMIRGLTAGAEDFLTKPVERVELCMRVRNLIRLRAHGVYFDKYSRMLEGKVLSRTVELAARTSQATVLAEQAALLDLAQDAIVVQDMHGRVMYWNRGAEIMYGWPSEVALGRLTQELLGIEFFEPGEDIEATVLREGKWEGEAIHHKRDGTRLIVACRWTLQHKGEGIPDRILTFTNDVTAHNLAESNLRLLTERLSLATAVAKVGVWEWNQEGNTLIWDDTMFEIYGFTPIVPMPYEQWSAAVESEDLPAVETAFRKTIKEKGQGSSEYRIVRKDGSIRNISAVQKVILNESGIVSRLIGVNVDITEQKDAEAILERSGREQLRFKDEFLSHVSHELRSPLTAIKQFTSILLGGFAGELNVEQLEFAQIILRNIRQLQSMIDDLLEVTRLENGKLRVKLESISVSDAVTDTMTTLEGTARSKRITLSCGLPNDLPAAYADQIRLRQILIILLDNAIKFTPEGGEVRLQASLQEDPRFLLIQVSDTGCGISPEAIDRIFERLYQVTDASTGSRKGLGLGLFICKELVTQQGGLIWVERQLKTGSTLSFTLPVFSLNNETNQVANSEAVCNE